MATGQQGMQESIQTFMCSQKFGVPGRTGHDFENYYDEATNTLIWFSKPGKHSSQPTFQKLATGELTPYFFVR